MGNKRPSVLFFICDKMMILSKDHARKKAGRGVPVHKRSIMRKLLLCPALALCLCLSALADGALSLYRGHAQESVSFRMENAFPGDSVSQDYVISLSHNKALNLYFEAELTEQSNQLGDVLQVTVELPEEGAVLYSGSFSDLFGQTLEKPVSGAGESLLRYRIGVSMPTSAGNEYAQSHLLADFRWFIAVEDEAALTPPNTGDDSPIFLLSALLALSALCLAVLLLRRRRKEERHGGE